jgi:hypothetical protein
MSKVLLMTIQNLVNIAGVTDSTPLNQTYVVSMDTDAASKTIGNIKKNVFSRVRREARNVYEEHLQVVGTPEKLDGAAMRLQFKEQMESAEAEYDGKDPDVKAKNTWNQNKRNLARALFLGVDLIEHAESSSGDINTLCTEIEAAAEAAEDAEAKKARGDAPADAGGTGAPPAVAPENVGEGIVFATKEDEAAFHKIIELMVGISQKDPKELTKFLKGTVSQLDAKSAKVVKAFAKPQAA